MLLEAWMRDALVFIVAAEKPLDTPWHVLIALVA
jgi:hypothetical protein